MKRRLQVVLALMLAFLCFPWITQAQIDTNFAYQSTVMLPAGYYTIYDNGGPSEDYQSNSNDVLEILPHTQDSVIVLSGSYHTENWYDKIYIYSGIGSSKVLEETLSGYGTIDSMRFEEGGLTIKFTSDYSNCHAGFTLNVSLDTPPTCFSPKNLRITDIQPNQATLQWKARPEHTYQISYESVVSEIHPEVYSQTFTTTDSTFTLTDLHQYTQYNITIKALCNDGSETHAITGNFTTEQSCFRPINFYVSSAEDHQFTVTWDTYNEGATYRIICYDNSNYLSTPIDTIITTELTATFTGLTHNSSYYVTGQTLCSDNEVSPIISLYAYTATSCFPPDYVIATDTTENSITLAWPSATCEQYEIWYEYYDYDDHYRHSDTIITTDTTLQLTGLNQNTRYNIYVREKCNATDYSYAYNTQITTKQICFPAENFRIIDKQASFVTVAWTPRPNHTYHLYGGELTDTVTATDSTYTFTNLHQYSRYSFEILTQNTEIPLWSNHYRLTAYTAQNCFTPTNFVITDIQAHQLTANWEPSPNHTYQLWAEYNDGLNYTSTDTVTINSIEDSSYTFTGLIQRTSYSVHIRTICNNNYDTLRTLYNYAYTTATCENPSINIINRDAHSITVAWDSLPGQSSYYAFAIGQHPDGTPYYTDTIHVTNDTAVISNLQQNTSYTICVYSHCGGDDYGNLMTIYSSTTQDCYRPYNLHALSIESNQAILAWDGDLPLQYMILIDTVPMNMETFQPDTLIVNDTMTTVTGLTEYTTYYTYIYTLCQDGTIEGYTPYIFQTPCNPITELPISWDFSAGIDGVPMEIIPDLEDLGSIIGDSYKCWLPLGVYSEHNYRVDPDFVMPNVIINDDKIYLGLSLMPAEDIENYTGQYRVLFGTQLIDRTQIDFSNTQLRFRATAAKPLFSMLDMQFFNQICSVFDEKTIYVGVLENSIIPTIIDTIQLIKGVHDYVVQLDKYQGEGKVITFMDYPGPVTIDYITQNIQLPPIATLLSVSLEAKDAQLRPQDLHVTSTSNSITFDWSEEGDANEWKIAYGTDTNNYSYVTTTTHPYTFNNLPAETKYFLKVCSKIDENYSNWSTMLDVSTKQFDTLYIDSIGYGIDLHIPLPFMPYNRMGQYSYSQQIIHRDEIHNIDTIIDGIGLNVNSCPGKANNVKVYLGHTMIDQFDSVLHPFVDPNTLSLWYEGPLTANYDWNTIIFDEPFIFHNDSNLVIAIMKDDTIQHDCGMYSCNPDTLMKSALFCGILDTTNQSIQLNALQTYVDSSLINKTYQNTNWFIIPGRNDISLIAKAKPACYIPPTYTTLYLCSDLDSRTIDTIYYDGNAITEPGQYIWHYTTAQGCDSAVVVNVIGSTYKRTGIKAEACGSYTWHGKEYVYDSTLDNGYGYIYYDDTARVANNIGCDSIYQMFLVITKGAHKNVNISVCGESFTWINGVTYTESVGKGTEIASPEYTYHTDGGCDSTLTLNLTLEPYNVYTFNANGGVGTMLADTTCKGEYILPDCEFTYEGFIFDYWTINQDSIPHYAGDVINLTNNAQFIAHWISACEDVIINESLVACDSVTWRGQTYTETGMYRSITPNVIMNHCDSIYTLDLTINNTIYDYDYATACDAFTWIDGNTYTESLSIEQGNAPTYTLAAANGCDSIITLSLDLLPHINIAFNANGGVGTMETIDQCEGEYIIPACEFTREGYGFTHWTTNIPRYAELELIPGETISVYADTANSFQLIAQWISTCEDVFMIDTLVACDSLNWHGSTYTETGTYRYIASDVIPGGCDSLYNLDLTINNSVYSSVYETACDTYTWINGETYTQSVGGNNGDSPIYIMAAANGCDSIISLTLDMLPHITITFDANGGVGTMPTVTPCMGDYILPECAFTNEGFNFDHWTLEYPTHQDPNTYLPNDVVTLNNDVQIKAHWNSNCSNTIVEETLTACDSLTWHGTTYTETGDYRYVASDVIPGGCDSIYTLDLTINNTQYAYVRETACDSYTWIDGNTYTESLNENAGNAPTYTTTATNGCDSIITLDLYMLPHINITFDANGGEGTMAAVSPCEGDYTLPTCLFSREGYAFDYWTIEFDDHNDTTHYLPDDEVFLYNDVQIKAHWLSTCTDVTTNDVLTACDSLTWHGTTYTETGDYRYVTTNIIPGGCDSIYTLNLTINNTQYAYVRETACDSYTWIDGNTYTESLSEDAGNAPTYTTTATNGCDSIITLNLYMLPHINITFDANGGEGTMAAVSPCEGDYIIPECEFTNEGYYFDHWTIEYNDNTDTTHYLPNDEVFLYNDVQIKAHWSSSCHDIVTNQTEVACDSLIWRGQTYNTSGAYTETVTGVVAGGCDSIFNLNLTINTTQYAYVRETACDSYTWIDGNTYTESLSEDAGNAPTYTITAANGCDSIITLNLSLLPHINITFDANGGNGTMAAVSPCEGDYTLPTCEFSREGYTFAYWTIEYDGNNDTTHYSPNDVVFLTNDVQIKAHWSSSCQDIVTNQIETACDSLTWRGQTYYNSGVYTETITDVIAGGCDSIFNLNLTINTTQYAYVNETACDSYTWIDGNTYTESLSEDAGNAPTYTTTATNGCDSIITLNLTINQSTSFDTTITDTVVVWGDTIFRTTTDYTYTIPNAAGCDSIITLHINILETYYISATSNDETMGTVIGSGNYEADAIAMLTAIANDGYHFVEWQDHNTDNPRIITVTADAEYIATFEADEPTGIDDLEALNVKVYPNPTSGKLTIEAEDLIDITVYDMQGRNVATYTTATIDLTNQAAGVYTLQINTQQGQVFKHIIKR